MRIFLPIVLISAIIITTSPAQADHYENVPNNPGINIPEGPLASFVNTINNCVGSLLLGGTVSDEPQKKAPSKLTEDDMISIYAAATVEDVAAAAAAVCVENT